MCQSYLFIKTFVFKIDRSSFLYQKIIFKVNTKLLWRKLKQQQQHINVINQLNLVAMVLREMRTVLDIEWLALLNWIKGKIDFSSMMMIVFCVTLSVYWMMIEANNKNDRRRKKHLKKSFAFFSRNRLSSTSFLFMKSASWQKRKHYLLKYIKINLRNSCSQFARPKRMLP